MSGKRCRYIRGIMGKAETLYSTKMKQAAQITPNTSKQMTVGLDQGNRVPPSDMGIKRKTTMAELSRPPRRSIFFSFVTVSSLSFLEGKTKYTSPLLTRASPARTKKNERHEAVSTKPAAKNGPMVLPTPTQHPIIPWYL